MTVVTVFDTENTSLLKTEAAGEAAAPRIIEISAVKLRIGNTNQCYDREDFTMLVNPRTKISDEVTKITSIDDEMVRGKPPFSAVYPHLAHFFLGSDALVGHNLAYDRDVLAYELQRIGKQHMFPWPPNHYCTVEIGVAFNGFRSKLGVLYEQLLGKPLVGAHRSLADARATAECFLKLLEMGQVDL